jgi:hypothetical protein
VWVLAFRLTDTNAVLIAAVLAPVEVLLDKLDVALAAARRGDHLWPPWMAENERLELLCSAEPVTRRAVSAGSVSAVAGVAQWQSPSLPSW